MKYPIYLTCILVAVVAGCSNKSPKPSTEEPKGLATPVLNTKPVVATTDAGLEVDVVLSTNAIVVGGNLSITARLVNADKTDLTVNRDDLSVWLSVTDSHETTVAELPFMDEISAPSKAAPLVVSAGGSQIIRVFGAQVTEGSWEGFGTSGKFKGVGLVVQRDAGASCYPLSGIPGDYFLRCHLRIRSTEDDVPTTAEIVSPKVRVSVTE